MTEGDIGYVRKVIDGGHLHSPCLELGAGYGGSISKSLVTGAGKTYFGTDLMPGESVDFVADFEKDPEELSRIFASAGELGSILILNVLEHCFDPIRVLDNSKALLRKGGTLVVLTPAVWPLHDYPRDCWRINPNFYEEYAKRRGMKLVEGTFEYIGIGSVGKFREPNGNYRFPAPAESPLKALYSRAIHKLLNTTGRGMFFPSHVAIGAVLRKE